MLEEESTEAIPLLLLHKSKREGAETSEDEVRVAEEIVLVHSQDTVV